MQSRIRRFIVPALLLASGCAAATWAWQLAQHLQSIERAGASTAARITRIEELLDDLQDREFGYVGSGHVDGRSLAGASALLAQIVVQSSLLNVEALAAGTVPARAAADISAALGAAGDRAQKNLSAGRDLMAADILFTETRLHRRNLRRQLRELRAVEARAAADARSSGVQRAWVALAGVALLYAWTLIRWSRPPAAVPSLPAAATREPVGEPPPDDASVNLIDAADLCTAIGRLQTAPELQRILERTRALLGASGVVVWMGAGEELFPAASVGYDLQELSRGGPIPLGAGNATASAWRTGTLQIVPGDATSQGALVAPLLGAERCIGALAIEVTPGRESDTATRAVATMIAAQLAAVVTGWPAPSSTPQADVLSFERMANVTP